MGSGVVGAGCGKEARQCWCASSVDGLGGGDSLGSDGGARALRTHFRTATSSLTAEATLASRRAAALRTRKAGSSARHRISGRTY